MTRRLLIQAGAASPFRVSSAAGGDAGSASPFNVIFDGNQMPLRYLTKGYLFCNGLAENNLAPAFYTQSLAPVYSTPAGQFPVFSVQEWRSVSPNPPLGQTPYRIPASASTGGIGGVLANGYFYGIVTTRQVYIPVLGGSPYLSPFPTHYICYLVFKNYG